MEEAGVEQQGDMIASIDETCCASCKVLKGTMHFLVLSAEKERTRWARHLARVVVDGITLALEQERRQDDPRRDG